MFRKKINQTPVPRISHVLSGLASFVFLVMLNFISPAQSSAFFWNISSLLPNNDMLRALYPEFDKFNPHGVYPVNAGTLGVPIETDYAPKLCEQKILFGMMHIPKVHQAANAFKVGIGDIFFSNHIIEFPTSQLAQKYFSAAREQLEKCNGVIIKNPIHRYGYDWIETIESIMDANTKKYNDRLVGSVLFSGFPLATSSIAYPSGLESYTSDARIWGKVVYWTVAQSHTELSEKIIKGITPNIKRYTPYAPLARMNPLPKHLIVSHNR